MLPIIHPTHPFLRSVPLGPFARRDHSREEDSTPDRFSTTVSCVPANLSPEYKAAEASFRKSRDPRERLEFSREMFRVIPKHKGNEQLPADIKTRIKALAHEHEGA